MTNKEEKDFDTVQFFRTVKFELAKRTQNMTLEERLEFSKKLFDRKIECHGGMEAFLEDVENLKKKKDFLKTLRFILNTLVDRLKIINPITTAF